MNMGKKKNQNLVIFMCVCTWFLASACADDVPEGQKVEEFVSADESYGLDGSAGRYGESNSVAVDDAEPSMMGGDMDADADADGDGDWAMDTDMGGEEETSDAVVEGDLYRVFDNGTLLNLNSYRGLQIIDVSEPSFPTIVGRYPLRGTPVEMYAYDNKAVILFNNWQGYRQGVNGLDVQGFFGGLVVTVDLTDPTAPTFVSQQEVEGYIQTSRMIQGDNKHALYLAAYSESGTLVHSFSIDSSGALQPASQLTLDANVTDIAATSTALLVAGAADDGWTNSAVSIIDISDPDGQMVEMSTVETVGMVQKKTDMSLYGNILRVVSGRSGSTNSNHLQTWDVTDMAAPVAVDHDSFGDTEDLYATLFLGNSAFFVTFMQTDPFHAFEIDDSGVATEHAEYIISGWNDFFKPAFDQTRIVGIGMGDEGLAVSLYDTALDNDAPFIARAELGADVWGSEASWDDRAFTVLDNAVSVFTEDGVEETGLVLLPYSRWNEVTYIYESAVQILTFSPTTLTVRGSMQNSAMVRRSFLTAESDVANMSEEELNLFNFSNPDEPSLLGSVELAPWYSAYIPMGRNAIRVKSRPEYFDRYLYCNEDTGMKEEVVPGALEVISAAGGPDTTEALATVEISPYSQVLSKGNLVVVISPVATCDSQWTIDTYDFTDPVAPVHAGSVSTALSGYNHLYGSDTFYDSCYGGGCLTASGVSNARIIGNALVIPTTAAQSETLETKQYCETTGNYSYLTDEETEYGWTYSYYNGSILCEIDDDGSETCSGSIQRCTEVYNESNDYWDYSCEDVVLTPEEQMVTCWYDTLERHWESYVLNVIDLSDPTAPALLPEIAMPTEQEAAGLYVRDNHLLVNHKIPYEVKGDSRAYVKYFVTFVNLTEPSDIRINQPINIPGAIFASYGSTYVTRDPVYTDSRIDTTLNTITFANGIATKTGSRKFESSSVDHMVVDDLGRAFVTLSDNDGYSGYDYDLAVYECEYMAVDGVGMYYDSYCYGVGTNTLDVIDLTDESLTSLGTLELNSWSSLQDVKENRALLSVPGGVLIVDVTDAAAPVAQAFYPTQGWDQTFTVVGTDAVVTAGPYGIYRFDMSVQNLLQ